MQFNLFTWLREGVKQSVVLGVADAIETIGVPEGSEDANPRFLELIQNENAGNATGGRGGNRRKRLGKSLKDLQPAD
jgi:hypothetical protein